MNKWVKKSIDLAKGHGYLDRLSEIYPINPEVGRNIKQHEIEMIKNAFKGKNKAKLISALLDLKRFPFDDPYIGFFRKDRGALERNPKTVRRIGKKLFKMGIEEIVIGATRAKTPSRQIGQMFKNWLPKLKYPILPKEKFLKHKGVAILEGGDVSLMNFAKEELGYKREKGLDLVMKIKNKFIIGESKLITTSGGTQDKSFREGISFVKNRNKNKKVIQIAILDGVLWLTGKKKNKKPTLYDTVQNLSNKEIALSALLLNEFIKSQI